MVTTGMVAIDSTILATAVPSIVKPILPLWVFSRRILLTTSLISAGCGAILVGLTSYMPTYLENSIRATPVIAGLALAALTIGWPISASRSSARFC